MLSTGAVVSNQQLLAGSNGDAHYIANGQFATLDGVQPVVQQQPGNTGTQPGTSTQPQQPYSQQMQPMDGGLKPAPQTIDPALAAKAAERFQYGESQWRDLPFLVLFAAHFLVMFILCGTEDARGLLYVCIYLRGCMNPFIVVCIYECMYFCMVVCACLRERVRERGSESVCVCVCVCTCWY
jgi:hypothetical protein